ncbi:MAG: hypothetical protein PHO10_08815 [Gemmiger sp.]|nr:hypothetical protein [Gemmiger sp.]
MSTKMERALQSAAASSRIEGYKVSALHMEIARKILDGSLSMDAYLAQLKAKAAKC